MTQRMSAAEFRASLQRKPATDSTPSVAGGSVTRGPKTKRKSPTNSLTKAIISLLQLEGCTVWRQNNGAVYDPTLQAFRAGSVTPGISDVLGYHRSTGRFLAVEVKVGKDELTKEQTRFLDEVKNAGGFACEGRSLDQVRHEFHQWRKSLLTEYPAPILPAMKTNCLCQTATPS